MNGLRCVVACVLCGLAMVWIAAVPVAAQASEVRPAEGAAPQPPQPAPEATPQPAAPVLEPALPATQPFPVPQPAALVPEGVPEQRPVLPPADPIAAQAFGILETHCARCHQGGRLNRASPAAGFGNILRLDEVARDPALVWPGNPDASRLYTHVLRRLMPYDALQEQTSASAPSADEIQVLRTWISRLQPIPQCRDRRFVTRESIADTLRRNAEAAGPAAARYRYVSLAHLYNDCATPEAMYAYRQAVVRLFNSLSWKPGPVRVEPVDEARTLLRLNLDDIGWLPAHWERILKSGLDGPGHLLLLAKSATAPFGTDQPVVRGDWLADTVMKAPLYYDLLGLPTLSGEIARILQVDSENRRVNIPRELIKTSDFSRAGRVVEHYGTRNRSLWTAYEAAPKDGRRDLTETAANPAAAPLGYDATLSMFLLPNGLPGFFVTNERGDRVDQVPADVAKRSIAARAGVRAGIDCMGCHTQGPTARADAAATTEIGRVAARDREVVRESLTGVGVDASFRLDGVAPLVALVRQYGRPLSAERAAAELGTDTVSIAERLASQTTPVGALGRRLMLGLVGRGEFEREFRALSAALAAPLPPAEPQAKLLPTIDSDDPGPGVVLVSDKVIYKAGDALSLQVRAKADCHLTVVSIDQRGRGTVIFPSDFEPNNLLNAGSEIRLPADGAPYLFRLREKGRETIVAICSAASTTVDGIKHDFERQRFTDLGNYSSFLAQALEASKPAPQAAPVAAQPDAKGRGRRRQQSRPEPVEVRVKPEQITHTAITVEVR